MKDDEHRQSATESEPGLLYHYTTQAGLIGVLESKSIWATHMLHLNDSSEVRLGIEMFNRCLVGLRVNQRASELKRGSISAESIQKIERLLRESAASAIRELSAAEVFVSSFFGSANLLSDTGEKDPGDTLEQWRAYSGGSGGFSIGFDKKVVSAYIQSLGSEANSVVTCGSCTYESGTQEQSLQKAVQEIADAFVNQVHIADSGIDADLSKLRDDPALQRFAQSPPQFVEAFIAKYLAIVDDHFDQRIEPSARAFSSIVMRTFIMSAFLKSPAFRAENEWRIVMFSYGPPSEIRFRPGQSSLIPYVAIPLPFDPEGSLFRRVVVGPSPRINEAIAATKLLLKSKGYKIKGGEKKEGVEVIASVVPYRNW
jgi:hypothetical protein